jgi:hypothetical protein
MKTQCRKVFGVGVMIAVLAASIPVFAGGPDLFSEFGSDFKYTMNNGTEDVQDIVTAPFHFRFDMLAQPQVYFTLLGAGAALGGAFALDPTIRSQIQRGCNRAGRCRDLHVVRRRGPDLPLGVDQQ